MKSLEQIEQRIETIFANVFRVLLVVTIVGSIFTQNWLNLAVAVLTLLLTYLPLFLADGGTLSCRPSFRSWSWCSFLRPCISVRSGPIL